MRILLGTVLVLVMSAGLLGCESDCHKAARLRCDVLIPDFADSESKRCFAEYLFNCADVSR